MFAGRHGACGTFYQAECQNAFKDPFQQLSKDDVLLGQISTMVLYVDRWTMEFMTTGRDEWPHVLHLIVQHIEDTEGTDLDILWQYIRYRRFRTVKIYGCESLPKHKYEIVQQETRSLEQQGIIGKLS